MRRILMLVLAMIVLPSPSGGEESDPLKEDKAKESYSLGYEFGSNVRKQEVDVDADILLTAVREALEGKQSTLEAETVRESLQQVRKKVMIRQERRARENAVRNLEEGKAFLKSNAAKEGVRTLPSGLQFRVLREGSGPTPKSTEIVSVHYRGTLVDGTEFDSSYGRGTPQTVHVQGVIPGWTEALQLMKAGAKWQLFVPPELAYDRRPFGRIPPSSTLVFEVELLSVGGVPDLGPAQTGVTENSDREP